MRILNYVVYTWSKYLRILNYALYTRLALTENVILLSRAWRRGMANVWVACQSNMTCVVYVSFACAARGIVGGSAWLEGSHWSSAPQNTILRSSHSYTDFLAWFAMHRNWYTPDCTRDLSKHISQLCFATWFNRNTVFNMRILNLHMSQHAHLELKFKRRTLQKCENSHRFTEFHSYIQTNTHIQKQTTNTFIFSHKLETFSYSY